MSENKKAIIFRLNDHGQGPELIRQVFLERGWVEFDEDTQEDDDWNIWWRTSRFRTSDYDQIYQWQRLNHYPKSTAITKKDGLARNLKRMKGVHGAGVYNFSPIAFNLPNDYTRYVAEYSRLKQQHHDSKTLNWICKPADMSRGRGIFVFRDISELQYDCTAVVQRYISNPFLIGGYKFDIRIYVAVPSFHPLSIYVYQEGIVRFSTEKFDLTSLNNVFAHLTNTSINKHSPAYTTDKERIGPGCKWTISQLRYYFHQNNIDDNMTWIRIMNIVTLTMLIQAPQVPKTRNCFELYGFDILIDENLKPWLLEVNFSPALSIDCQSDVVVKKPMLHDLMDLMNFKDIDKERGGEHFRGFTGTSRSKGPDSNIDRYSSGSRLSHRGSTTHRNAGLHKNLSTLSNLSKQTVQESVSYIENDLHENKEMDKEKMCFGLPLIHPEEESKRKDSIGSSGISSADEDNLKEIASETNTRQKSATNSIRNVSGNATRIQSAKVGPRAQSGLSSSRVPNNKSFSRETSQLNNEDNPNRNCNNNPVQNIMHTTTGPVNNSFERSVPIGSSNTLERTVTMSSVDKKPEDPKKPQVKGSIKSSATSDSGISNYSGSSENSDLSLKHQEEVERRKVLTNRRGTSSNAFGAEVISEQTGKKNKHSHIKSLRPHGNSNALRKIQAGFVPVPQPPTTARSRSRLHSSMDSAPMSERLGLHQTNARRSVQGRYTSRSVANFRSQTRPTSGKQSKAGHHGDKENGHVVRRGFNNNSRLNGRIRAHGHTSPIKPKSRGPPPRVGDFFLTFPFSDITLKSANSTLDPHQVIKEVQRLLKESLLPGVDKQESDSRKGFIPLGQFSDDPEARLWGPVKPIPEENS